MVPLVVVQQQLTAATCMILVTIVSSWPNFRLITRKQKSPVCCAVTDHSVFVELHAGFLDHC